MIQFRDQLFSIKYRLFCKPIPILLLGLLYFPETLLCQINSRHDPFDWVIYRKPGTIKSFTEGLSYIYIATESAGIFRYSFYGNQFEYPITRAQGLSSNRVNAIHFDKITGILWVATDKAIDYSYNAEGNWISRSLENYNLLSGVTIEQIGSSNNYLWILAGPSYLKLDRTSGVFLGSFTFPDEMEIKWSSGPMKYSNSVDDVLMDYTVMDGWLLNLNSFISPKGKNVYISTIYSSDNNTIWVGTDAGIIFQGDPYMKSFYPIKYGLSNTDVQTFIHSFPSWLGGRNYPDDEGSLSLVDPYNAYFDWYEGEFLINVDHLDIYENCIVNNEYWFGGVSSIIVYDSKRDFWRTLDASKGIPYGQIRFLEPDTNFIWAASNYEIEKINIKTKRSESTRLNNSLSNSYINDISLINNYLWVSTEYKLLCYNTDSEVIVPFDYVGNTNSIKDRIDVITKFYAVFYDGIKLYVATNQGIIAYNNVNSTWELITESTIYNNKVVKIIYVYNKQLFIVTDNSLIRLKMNKGFYKKYDYQFIGTINDIFVENNHVWLATNNGLIQFKWKKDL
ncbi:MAG: hypothetical protein CMG65_00905 [Candidatus Marinimicrobia bacterium]|nr:hypothetical protein [Candidatus Neomarinimicrobiota bacterium]